MTRGKLVPFPGCHVGGLSLPWIPAFAGMVAVGGWPCHMCLRLAAPPGRSSLGSRFRGNDGWGGMVPFPGHYVGGRPLPWIQAFAGMEEEGVGLFGSVFGWRPLPAAPPWVPAFAGTTVRGGHPYRQDGGERGTSPSPYRSTGQALAFPPRGKGLLLGLGLLLFSEADGFPVGGVFSHVDASFPFSLEGV